MSSTRYFLTILLFAVAAAAGCERGPTLGRVSGTVTLDGQPLPNARVTFTSENNLMAFGETDAQGQYELKSTDGRQGAELGTHKVTVKTERTGRNDAGEMVDFPETLPPRYHLETELSEVVEGGVQTIDLQLTSD